MHSISRRDFLKRSSAAAFTLSSGPYISKGLPDVIVIGAGATGCSCAWHLNKLGHKVIVIESSAAPCQQASQGAAGFVANWSGLHVPTWKLNERRMQAYGIQFYTELAGRSTRDIGFKKSGICYVYIDKNEWKNAQDIIAATDELDIPFEVLDKDVAQEILPVINFENVAGVINDRTSIRVRAADTIAAIAEEAKSNGVRFVFNSPVVSFSKSGSKVIGVGTDRETYNSGQVLIAAGAWSLKFLSQLNYHIPVKPLIETRYTTQPMEEIPGNLPLLIFSDIGFYIREEYGGLLIGGGDSSQHSDRQVSINNIPTSDNLRQHEQIHRIETHLRSIYDVMPVLSKACIREVRGGIPTFTSDTLFIADRLPSFDNLFLITACQEAGITHGPALGQMTANFISSGNREEGLSKYSLKRFFNK